MGAHVVIFAVERQRIRRAARKQHLIAGHPAADLRQSHCIARHTRRIDGIAHRQFGVVGHDLGGLGKGLFEGICGVV
ncbi:hypothetical protein IMCC21224_112753 [Puniceibacterium sp. IMCC21224]|nr:hypothetical protein IMCC21224_112753 [Puniceibacterium sp. IMCC21224]